MPDQPSTRLRLAKGAALACSLGLGALVIVNAQFGCDSPSATAPEDHKPAPKPQAVEHDDDLEDPVAAPIPDDRADANATANPDPEPVVEHDEPEPKPPTLMPASKSAGDFGAMRFPGEGGSQQQQQQAPNHAQNAAPQK